MLRILLLSARMTSFLFRLIAFSIFVHRISSDAQNDRQLQSVVSPSGDEDEPLVSAIPNLDKLPDLLIINPTFEPPQSNIPGQSSITRRELLLRTLQLRQQPTEAIKEWHPANVPKAQPLPNFEGQLFETNGGKRSELNVQNTDGNDVPIEKQQQLISGGAAAKRTKGKKETSKLLPNRPFLQKGDRSTPNFRQVKTSTTTSDSSIQTLKQGTEVSSAEFDSQIGKGRQIVPNSQNRQQLKAQKASDYAPYNNRRSPPNQQQPQQYQSRSVPQFQTQQQLPYLQPQQQQQQLQGQFPSREGNNPQGGNGNIYGQPLPGGNGNIYGQPLPGGNGNIYGQPLPGSNGNIYGQPLPVYQQQQPITHFAGQQPNQQRPQQQISVPPRRLNFYFTPSATTVNSDFAFAPGSPGFACLYGFPVPQYNTPRKRCIADHPMCGIQFTCVMDVHAVDEWGRELEQWWTQPAASNWNGARQQPQQQQNAEWTAQQAVRQQQQI